MRKKKTVGIRADKFAVNEHRAAAHARHRTGFDVRRVQPFANDDRPLRADKIVRYAHDLHGESVNPGSGNDGVPFARHPRLDVCHGHDGHGIVSAR